MTSHDVINRRFCSQLLFTTNGVIGFDELSDFRLGIIQIAKGKFPFGGLDTGRQLADSQSFGTEITFFNHSLGPGWKFNIKVSDEWAWIPVIEAAGPEGTGGHAKPTSDAAVEIHQDDPVRLPFPG